MTHLPGIYIHIPFCIKKCPYCDFYSTTDLHKKQDFINALMQELYKRKNSVQTVYDTLYIGGGTPSVLDEHDIKTIVESVYPNFTLHKDAEITMEVNPGTVDEKKLRGFRNSGINRLNIGVQSFSDENLCFLGRIHSAKDAALCMETARKTGFTNIGIDLIYGLPDQKKALWLFDLKKAISFRPEHLSCYILTYEPKTPMERARQNHFFTPLSEKRASRLFLATIDFLTKRGYQQYEISNFAINSNHRSRHNLKYWSRIPYIGFGPGAHSFSGNKRFWNVPSVSRYIDAMKKGKNVMEQEELSREQEIIETLFLGLRKTEGISRETFLKTFKKGFDKIFEKPLGFLENEGLVCVSQNHIRLTRKGQLFSDSVLSVLVDHMKT